MSALYEKLSARVPKIAERLLEEHRVQQLASAPRVAKIMFEGSGWQLNLKDGELRARFTARAWNMVLCEILEVIMESDVELVGRIAALENRIK